MSHPASIIIGVGPTGGPSAAPGDMTKAVYDANTDNKIDVAAGGTGAGSAAAARTNLGAAASGANNDITELDGLTTPLGVTSGGTGASTAAGARTNLGLGALATKSTAAESDLSISDVTTGNVSTTAHGFAPKAPNDATKYLDGTGAYSVPAGSGGGGGSVPTGTGFRHVTGGAEDGAAVAVDLATADVTGTLPVGNLPVGTSGSTVAAGNDSRITGALQSASNLSDLVNAATARSNLGLGTAATHPTGDFAQVASNLSDLASASAARTNLGLATVAASGSASDLGSGTLPAGRLPALTGDVTTSAGSAVTAIASGAVTNGKLATGAVTDDKGSLAHKPACTVVATTNQTLSGTPTIDGVATAVGSVILCTAQTTGAENGPWVAAAGSWSRPTWYPSGGTTQAFAYITTLIRLGTVYQGSTWRMTTTSAVTIDTTTTAWSSTPLALGGIAAIGTNTLIGNNTGGTAAPIALTAAQIKTVLAIASSDVSGLGTAATLNVPSSGNAASGEVVKGSDTRLSDSRTPSSHHTTHENGGGDQLSLDGGQITGGTVAAARLGTMTGDSGSGGAKGAVPAPSTGDATKFLRGDATWAVVSAYPLFTFYADALDNPNSSDWTVNALANAMADATNAALTVRAFDDTTDEGVGFTVKVPTGATNIILRFVSRGKTAPAGARTVGMKLYVRSIPDNSAPGSWSAGTALTDIDIPTNANFQYDSQTIALATLSLSAGVVYQFELVRHDPAGGTELVGDWYLLSLTVDWS